MKRNIVKPVLFVLFGLLAGSLSAHLLSSVEAISFLTDSITLSWYPRADLDFFKYELAFQVKISVLSLLGGVLAYWIYRKIR